jgi:hypothetical protein
MASQKGKSPRASKRTLLYFYLNGNLHKRLHINRGADELTAWCYPLGKRVVLSYTQTRRFYEPAFSTQQVCTMLNRRLGAVERAILRGDIEEPQYTYGLNEHRKKGSYLWSEQNIMDAHAYFSTVHRGRPRKDGKITPQKLPTLRELRAMIRQEDILYVKEGDTFVPTWRATDL